MEAMVMAMFGSGVDMEYMAAKDLQRAIIVSSLNQQGGLMLTLFR
jgi:hypothetical protein